MKKRILALALAVTMTLTSMSFTAFAEENSAASDAAAIEAVADDTASGSAVEPGSGSSEETEATTEAVSEETTAEVEALDGDYPGFTPAGKWSADVFGDAGGQQKFGVNADGTAAEPQLVSDTDTGEMVYSYGCAATSDNSVDMRMGTPSKTDTKTISADGAVGKIASGSEGIVYYYQAVPKDDNFTLSATAKVNGLWTENNQVSFGAMIREHVDHSLNVPAPQKTYGNTIACGPINMLKLSDGSGVMSFGWLRNRSYGTSLITGDVNTLKDADGNPLDFTDLRSSATEVPKIGDEINISIKKSGSIYTLTYGDDTTTVDESDVILDAEEDGTLYAGFYVSRAADISFSKLRLSIEGAAVETGDWTDGGVGYFAREPLSEAEIIEKWTFTKTDDQNFKLATPNQGKIKADEESYAYYAIETPSAEDFDLKADVVITQNANGGASNPQQASAGLTVFNSKYTNRGPVEGLETKMTDNNFKLGTYCKASADTESYIVARTAVNKKATIDVDTYSNHKISNTEGATLEVSLRLRKSGDKFITYVNNVKNTYSANDVLTNDNCYVGFYATRGDSIEVKNMEFVAGSRKVSSIEVTKNPDKMDYILNEEFDPTGIEVTANYEDGGKGLVDMDDVILTGFSSAKAGPCDVLVSVGSATTTLTLDIKKLAVTSLDVVYAPIKDTYFENSKFNPAGIEIKANYANGKSETLSSSQYVLTMNGRAIDSETYFKASDAGKQTVTVSYAPNDNYAYEGVTNSFDLTIKAAKLTGIRIVSRPVETAYVGRDYTPSGLTVQAIYTLTDGSIGVDMLGNDEYTVSGYDNSKAQTITMTIAAVADPSITTTFDLAVKEVVAIRTFINTYPRMTFAVGEKYDASGLLLQTYYNDNTYQDMVVESYIYFDGTKYFTVKDGVETPMDEAAALAAPYYIDISAYDSSAVGETFVKIVPKGFSDIEFTLAIVDSTSYIWKPCIFGASSLGVAGVTDTIPSSVTVTTDDGTQLIANESKNEIGYQVMNNGDLQGVQQVRLNSWTGAGKVSGDQDGICYYYTRVNPNNNFQITADMEINRYIRDPEDKADFAKVEAIYKEHLAKGDSPEVALDKLRSGQECFGIMARDALPLDAEVNGNMNNITVKSSEARKDETGEPINLYEAWIAGIDGVTKSGVEAIFASNVVIAGACTDSTYPTDPESSTYYKKINMQRINIMIRKGVTAIDGGGERVGILSTTDHIPLAGDKYRVTLTKMTTGYAITTYDYQTGKTNTQYDFYNNLDISDSLLTTETGEDIWVGFFASRYADVNVSNIHLYETDPAYDPNIGYMDVEEYSPKVTVVSSLYTTDIDYTLVIKSNNPSGGFVTIKQGDKVIYSGSNITKRNTSFAVKLEPNSTTEFSIVYTPSTADNCVSFDDVVTRFSITQKADLEVVDDTIYCAPYGTVKGTGTRENPLDLETAIHLMGSVNNLCHNVVMLDGTYNIIQKNIELSKTDSGLVNARKVLKADEGAHPVIDLQNKVEGFRVSAHYWNFEGIEICNALGNGKAFYLGGQHNIIKDCTFHDNGELGFQISRTDNDDDINNWPAYNLIQDCESYNNCDPSKNNADGFASKLTSGFGNVFKGCIAHHNLDDGWDCYTKLSTGVIGPVVLEDCVSYRNGYQLLEDGTEVNWGATSGGNGFKLGGENIYVKHYVKDSLTFMNKAKGVDANFNPAMKLRNVIAYANEERNIGLYSGSSVTLLDANGNGRNADGKIFKYDYDIQGFVSAGATAENVADKFNYVDQLASENYDLDFANVCANPLINKSTEDNPIADYKLNYFAFDNTNTKGDDDSVKVSKKGDLANSVNGNGDVLDEATFFKSTDPSVSLNELGRYDRDADGKFILGDFLARTKEYVHDDADLVKLPNQGDTPDTPVTPDGTTETTTSSGNISHGGGGGGGGGGAAKTTTTTVATTEATTEATTADVEDDTETTTKAAVKVGTFTTPSGIVIAPPTGDKTVEFEDIAHRAWAVDTINKLAAAGVINGKSNTEFAPDEYCKRADFILTVVNALGLEADYEENFSDVADSKYYAQAVGVAKALGIATGYEDGTFKPEDTITRQDMMILVAKTIEILGEDLSDDTAVLDSFADADEISAYAAPYVAKLVNAGVAQGTDAGIEPKALITRAQMAVLVGSIYDKAVELAVIEEEVIEEESDDEAEIDAEEAEDETAEVTEEASEEITEETTEETTKAVRKGRG